MALQHHPRSLILAQNESAYATSYWSSKVTFVPSCPISEVLQVFCWKQHPTPISPEFWSVPLGLDGWSWVSEEWRPQANYSCNYFRTNSIYDTPTVPQRHGRIDGRTTYDSNTALALRASHGKNSALLLVIVYTQGPIRYYLQLYSVDTRVKNCESRVMRVGAPTDRQTEGRSQSCCGWRRLTCSFYGNGDSNLRRLTAVTAVAKSCSWGHFWDTL